MEAAPPADVVVAGSPALFVAELAASPALFVGERATTKAEERAPQLKQQAQQSASASATDEGNGAAVYADTGTQEFGAERTTLLRDRAAEERALFAPLRALLASAVAWLRRLSAPDVTVPARPLASDKTEEAAASALAVAEAKAEVASDRAEEAKPVPAERTLDRAPLASPMAEVATELIELRKLST